MKKNITRHTKWSKALFEEIEQTSELDMEEMLELLGNTHD